ncbi:MAG: type 1 glutamine amidotransferase [Proteobacteria bacterium]|nr:MAG: type 1 glutamine amidotransferase [Pseudomonadota bacterium]
MLNDSDLQHDLTGKRIAILAADGFEYVEVTVPRAALRAAGAEVDVVSLHHGEIRGMNLTAPTRTVDVDCTLDEASAQDYDGLYLPGGFVSPDFLRQSARARRFVRAFDEAVKPIATMCHGPWLLASSDLARGRTLTSWPGIRDDVVNAGGTWLDEPVVRDRNWVSSRGPQDLPRFVPAMCELFAAGTVAAAAGAGEPQERSVGVSAPRPDEPMPVAVAAARAIPGPTLRTAMAAALVAGTAAFAMRRAAR